MQELYKKMYASLVCQVDKSITDLTNIVLRENCEKDHILQVAKDLQQALQDAEEMYIEAEE